MAYTPKEILAVWHKCNGRCVYGERILVEPEEYSITWEIDHAIPLSKEGKDDLPNQLVACIKHNRQKGARQRDSSDVGYGGT